MWRADENGRLFIPKSELNPIPYKTLRSNIAVDSKTWNFKKEFIEANASIEKNNFIINGITKCIQF
jgi:hypothetical protein